MGLLFFFFVVFFCWSQSQLSLDEGRVLPGQVSSSWQGTSLMVKAAMQAANQEQFGLHYLAQGHFDMQLSSARSWDLNQQPSES